METSNQDMSIRYRIPVKSIKPPAKPDSLHLDFRQGPDEEPQARVHKAPEQVHGPYIPTTNTSSDVHKHSIQTAFPAEGTVDYWRDQALRLQAEMANFRSRQQRVAENSVEQERDRLLLAFLEVLDDLDRALASPTGDEAALRQGLELTRHIAHQLVRREGAEVIVALGKTFDPHLQEAISTCADSTSDSNRVVQVVEAGYTIGERLLRPAKVIVQQ